MGLEDISGQREQRKVVGAVEAEEAERRGRCKRKMEGAEVEDGVRGWVEDEEEEAERNQQQRQRWGRSQVQQGEAELEGAAGEPAGGEAPREDVQAVEVQEEWGSE